MGPARIDSARKEVVTMSLEMMSTAMGLLFSILAVTVSLGALIVWIVGVAPAQGPRGRLSPQGANGSHREGAGPAAGVSPAA